MRKHPIVRPSSEATLTNFMCSRKRILMKIIFFVECVEHFLLSVESWVVNVRWLVPCLTETQHMITVVKVKMIPHNERKYVFKGLM